MHKHIIENKSLNDLKKKYSKAYKKGKIIYFTDKEVSDFKKSHESYEYKGKKYKLNELDSSLLDKKKTYYHIDNKFYRIPSKVNAKKITIGTVLGLAVITVGTFGGIHIYNRFNKVETKIDGSEEVIQKTEVEVTKPAVVGEEYKATIKLKEEAKQKKDAFMPAKLTKVTTGGVELSEWHKEEIAYNAINDTTEPENYYTYTLNETRDAGELYIKKVLGPVVVTFDLSKTKNVKIVTQPSKLEYYTTEAFTSSGLTVEATNINDETKVVTDYSLSIKDGYVFQESDVSDNKKVDVIYDNCVTSFNIKVKLNKTESISVSSLPSKVTYNVGDKFDKTGLVVKATDSLGNIKEVSDYSLSISDDYVFVEGDVPSKTIKVTYDGKETSFNVTVTNVYITALEIETNPNRMTFLVGEKFDHTGIRVNAIDSTTAKTDVTSLVTYSMGENDKFSEDDIAEGRKITITYKGVSTTLTVAVKMPTVLNVKEMPKTVYQVDESLDLSGLKLATSISADGLFSGELDKSDCTITCDGTPITGEIKFTNADVGVIKKISITYKTLPTKNIFVAVPFAVTGQTELNDAIATGKYNAFKLMDQADPYYLQNGHAPVGSTNLNVMFVGEENKNVRLDTYTGFIGDEGSYFSNYNLGGFNVMFENITMVTEHATNESNAPRDYSGFVGYNSAIYNKVTFSECMFSFWGNSITDYTSSEALTMLSSFYNCTFNAAESWDTYILWTYSGTFEFYNTVFNAYAKAFHFYRQQSANTVLYRALFDTCTFNVTKTAEEFKQQMGEEAKPMIYIKDKNDVGTEDPSYPALINLNNCDYSSFTNKGYDLVGAKSRTSETSPSYVYENGKHIFGRGLQSYPKI